MTGANHTIQTTCNGVATTYQATWQQANSSFSLSVVTPGTGTSTPATSTTATSTTTKTVLCPKVTAIGYQLRGTAKKTSTTLKWTKVANASGYEVYGAKNKKKVKKLATITNNKTVKWTQRKLKKGTTYKYYVRAYYMDNGKKKYCTSSSYVYVSTTCGKLTNVKKVKTNVSKVSLKKGKSKTIKTTLTKYSKSKKLTTAVSKVRYTTTNSKVATVSKKGKIKAKKKGTCYVYASAPDGTYKKIKVTVK